MEKFITSILKSSGEILLKMYGKIQNISVKSDQSNIVTQADIDSEALIVKAIKEKYPGHNILAEETGYLNQGSDYTWIIDPLDGTSNFSAGIPWFGILIALIKENQPVMAGMYLPFYDTLYFAEKGKGAFRNGQRIEVTKEENLKNVLISYSLDYSENVEKTEEEARIIMTLVRSVRNIRSTNSLVDFCYTAEGKLGGSLNQSTKIWDIAAPSLFIQEAGGMVTDIEGNSIKFTFTQENYQRNFTIVAASKCLLSSIMKAIEEV